MLDGPSGEDADALTERMAAHLIRHQRYRTRWRRWLWGGLALIVLVVFLGLVLTWWFRGVPLPWLH